MLSCFIDVFTMQINEKLISDKLYSTKNGRITIRIIHKVTNVRIAPHVIKYIVSKNKKIFTIKTFYCKDDNLYTPVKIISNPENGLKKYKAVMKKNKLNVYYHKKVESFVLPQKLIQLPMLFEIFSNRFFDDSVPHMFSILLNNFSLRKDQRMYLVCKEYKVIHNRVLKLYKYKISSKKNKPIYCWIDNNRILQKISIPNEFDFELNEDKSYLGKKIKKRKPVINISTDWFYYIIKGKKLGFVEIQKLQYKGYPGNFSYNIHIRYRFNDDKGEIFYIRSSAYILTNKNQIPIKIISSSNVLKDLNYNILRNSAGKLYCSVTNRYIKEKQKMLLDQQMLYYIESLPFDDIKNNKIVVLSSFLELDKKAAIFHLDKRFAWVDNKRQAFQHFLILRVMGRSLYKQYFWVNTKKKVVKYKTNSGIVFERTSKQKLKTIFPELFKKRKR